MTQYEKLSFVNGSPPALNAATLSYMEDGIAAATEGVTAVEKTVKDNKTETDTALATKADKTEVDTALATKADKSTTYTKSEVDTALAKKPGFDDVYTAEEADDHFLSKYDAGNTYATKANLSTKLDNTAGSVTTDNIASKAVTSDKIANGAITALKLANNAVLGGNIAQNQISTNHLQNGAVTTDKLAEDVTNQFSELKGDLSKISENTLDKTSLFGINEFNVEYSISQLGYKTDGSRVSWSNIYSTKKYDCTRTEEFICEKVGGQIVNTNTKFPSVIFFDENDSVVSYILPDVQLSGTSYTYTGTVKVPTEAKYVAFNKAKGTDFESTNSIRWLQREIGEEIKTVKELDLFANAKANINKVLIENSKKLTDCAPCVGELEVRGENAEIYVFGKNRCPRFPAQSFENNGITFAVDEFGKITANGTATSTSAYGYLYWDSYFRYEPNTYYSLLKASDEDNNLYKLSAAPNNLAIYPNFNRTYTISSAIPSKKQSDGVSKCYIGLTNLTVGQILDNVEITISLQTECRVAKHYISEEPQKIVHSNGSATYKVHLEKGSEITVIREGTTDVKLTYVTHPNDFYEETEGGIVERNNVNPDWWGWNLPDGDAFFRYNCNPYYWPQYKEVVGPMLVRGQLVVGKNKPNLGGGKYDSTVPARYGFHIFEGVGNEEDGKRLTMLGGKFKDACAIFYFKTPYDGDDSNLEGGASYGWVQLGADNVRKGVWFNEDNSRFHVPIVFDLNVGNVEGNTDEIEIANSEKYNVDFRTEEKYPIGTMYYNSTMGKFRVKTPSGWKSLAFEEN